MANFASKIAYLYKIMSRRRVILYHGFDSKNRLEEAFLLVNPKIMLSNKDTIL